MFLAFYFVPQIRDTFRREREIERERVHELNF